MPIDNVKSIIAISSCKGGVGKSTAAALLAMKLAQRGLKIGLVDADIFGPSLPTLFRLQNTSVYTNEQKQLIPVEKNNLKLMSFGFLLGDAPAVMRGPMVSQYIQQILHNTAWGELDYLLIDMPPGTGDVQLTITQILKLTGAVIVTTPHTLSLVDTARGVLMFEKVQVPILGIIENMTFFECNNCNEKHYPFGEIKGTLTDKFGIESLAQWPMLSQFSKKWEEAISEKLIQQTVDNLIEAYKSSQDRKSQTPQVQFDARKVTLTWPDGSTVCVGNRDLRLSCCCAVCVDEFTGKKILKKDTIKENIAPKEITPLGHYAIAITWNDGHSSGIYPYKKLCNSN